MVQRQKQLGCKKGRKLIKIYRIYRAEEDNEYNFLKLFEIFFSVFQVLQISLLFVLFPYKIVQLSVQVCCLFYFLLHSSFFKGKVKSGIFNGFYGF